jgi:hypothetical protein
MTTTDDPSPDQRKYLDRIDKTIVALLTERMRLTAAGPLPASSEARILALIAEETCGVPRER